MIKTEKSYILKVVSGGRVQIPLKVRAELDLHEGDCAEVSFIKKINVSQ